jgi:two-component system OmpR family sensor kinase
VSRLYLRLLLWFCIANVLTLLISVFLTERLTRHAYGVDPDWPALAAQANRAYESKGREGLERWIDERREAGFEATLFEGERNLSGRRPPTPRLLHELLASDNVEIRLRPDMRVIGQRVVGRDGVARQFVALRRPPPPPRLEQLLAMQIGLSVLVIGIIGWWLARSIARPVAAVGEAARLVAAGDLSARVQARFSRGADEVGDLARDFDRMAARIEALVAQERGVLQDVSHELRSPLARLHLLIDLARGAPPAEAEAHFARAEHEISRLDRLIGDALALSRLESDLPGAERESVNLGDLINTQVEDFQLEADARRIRLDADPAFGVLVSGSAVLLGRALDNLISNAIKFSPDEGRVRVSLRTAGAHAELSVRDWGPGVPDDELAILFRPFFRGSNAARAEGHGLGLAIVERIAQAHQGSVEAANAEGGGLEVKLRLPL